MPDIRLDDTIAAISTPPGDGGIGIVRLSGPQAIPIVSEMFRGKKNLNLSTVDSHTVHFGSILDEHNELIDQVLVTVFRAPKSYTAEDVVEINAHGGSRILQNILSATVKLGARHAEPGEFTRRAFLNGRIDLAQAEAVLDLIRAKTDRSIEVALRQLAGDLSGELKLIKDRLMKIYAHLEAYLDFPEEHLEVYSNEDFKARFVEALDQLKRLIQSFSKGQLLRDGACVVIVGRPNVGKSSLMNVLLDRDRALVSEIPGTTRDILEESVELDGCLIRLVDTAGLWTSSHPLDQAAMERSRRYFNEGDLFLWILDAGDGIREEDKAISKLLSGKKVISVINKIDLDRKADFNSVQELTNGWVTCALSAKTREGIEHLERAIVRIIFEEQLGQESVLVTRLRHKRALESAFESLQESLNSFQKHESLELVTTDLKRALDALRELVGEVYSEDLLDVIFSEFCIGK